MLTDFDIGVTYFISNLKVKISGEGCVIHGNDRKGQACAFESSKVFKANLADIKASRHFGMNNTDGSVVIYHGRFEALVPSHSLYLGVSAPL